MTANKDVTPVTELRVPSSKGATAVEVRLRRSAVQLFAEKGYAATGIRDIARATGITSATLYHYTSSKEALLMDIMRDGHRALTESVQRQLKSSDLPEERLGILVGGLAAAHATNPLSTRVVDSEIRALAIGSDARTEIVMLRDHFESFWTKVLSEGIKEGVFTIDDEHLTRLSLISMCTGMSYWYRPALGHDLVQLATHFSDLALGAVRAQRNGKAIRGRDLRPLRIDLVPILDSEPPHI